MVTWRMGRHIMGNGLHSRFHWVAPHWLFAGLNDYAVLPLSPVNSTLDPNSQHNCIKRWLGHESKALMTGIACVSAKSFQSCLTLCDSMDCSLPDSSVHGIFQARTLDWVAMPSSRGIFPTQGLNPHLLQLQHWQAGSLPLAPPGKPKDWD